MTRAPTHAAATAMDILHHPEPRGFIFMFFSPAGAILQRSILGAAKWTLDETYLLLGVKIAI